MLQMGDHEHLHHHHHHHHHPSESPRNSNHAQPIRVMFPIDQKDIQQKPIFHKAIHIPVSHETSGKVLLQNIQIHHNYALKKI